MIPFIRNNIFFLQSSNNNSRSNTYFLCKGYNCFLASTISLDKGIIIGYRYQNISSKSICCSFSFRVICKILIENMPINNMT